MKAAVWVKQQWQRGKGYTIATGAIVLGTLLAIPMQGAFDLSNIALLYVLAVVAAGVRYGRSVAIFAALFGSLSFAYVFVPPHFSLAITDPHYFVSALIMLGVAVLVGHLTSDLRQRTEALENQSAHTKALYEFARQLTATQSSAAVLEHGQTFLARLVGAEDVHFVAPEAFGAANFPVGSSLIQACIRYRKLLQLDPTRFPDSTFIVLPLLTASSQYGVIYCKVGRGYLETQAQRDFLETVGSLIAVALERTHYAEVAQQIEVQHAAEQLRSTILSSLSHDIRTPLTALVGTADTLLLAQGLAPERQRTLLSSVREQAHGIHLLVNNLLEMARLQSGNIELNLAWQPVEEVIGATLQQLSYFKPRAVSVQIAPGLPPVRIDAVLMERALWNLLENAIKYSLPESPIELSASQQGETLDLCVADRGKGLSGQDIEGLFGLFQRGQSESSIPGAGIGLAIARTVAEVHQGRLWAEAREGGGSCFHLSLPLGTPPCLAITDDPANPSGEES